MMVELILVACLLKEPRHCEEFHIPFAAEIQAPQCLWQSQFRAAQWVGQHPAWVIRELRCEMPRA